ncbi:MAG: endolytic transglycosylase MltG [Bacteroidales bacterium]|nr:endolytic transglycosylase MltG [Bacteroidales bacterium]
MKSKPKKKSSKKINWGISIAILLFILLGAIITIRRYTVDPFTNEAFTVYIRPETTFDELLKGIQNNVDKSTYYRFKRLAKLDGYELKMKPGAYKLDPSMSPVDVYRILSRGLQTPVSFKFNNIRTKEQFAQSVSRQLMADSASIMTLFNDSTFIAKYGFNNETIVSMFFPDSYEFYWTISAEEIFNRMKKEYDRFWTEAKIEKAKSMGVTPQELTTIASIAEEETNDKSERGVVGRLYINRYQINMPLQADPTIKFALQDFSLKRILNTHLEVDSPYNTYKYPGVPPGPIRFVSKQTLQTILSADAHDYIYMCAKEDFSGTHNFAKSFSQHQVNANRYRKALNARNIK